jgi:hypothetical protein
MMNHVFTQSARATGISTIRMLALVLWCGLLLPVNAAEDSDLRTITVLGVGEVALERGGMVRLVAPQEITAEELSEHYGAPVKLQSTNKNSIYRIFLDAEKMKKAREEGRPVIRDIKAAQIYFSPGPLPENVKEVRHQALEKALFHAKEKAELLARTYDMIVGEPLSITEKALVTKEWQVIAKVEVTFEMR